MGQKDILIIRENDDGTNEFQSYFMNGCTLQQQTSPDSPDNILDAKLQDLDGDGVLDLAVLEETGSTFFVNDKVGTLLYTSEKTKVNSRAIESLDFNMDGKMDVLIATNVGISVQAAEDTLVYSEYQLLPSGDTVDLVLFDFDSDGDSDLVSVDSDGTMRFYENRRSGGFSEVGKPVVLNGTGKMKILDSNNDGSMDVVVEIAPGVEESVEIGSVFGIQKPPVSGKRQIQFAFFDHLGTAKILTDNNGRTTWPHQGESVINETLPFGMDLEFDPVQHPEEAEYNLTFTNKELDRALDLHYFGARYYHASYPRFISPDPVGGTPEIPISWNRYLYCRNDPVNFFDPNGERELPYVEGQDLSYIGYYMAKMLPDATRMTSKNSEGKVIYNPDAFNCFSYVYNFGEGDPTDPHNAVFVSFGVTKWDNNADNNVRVLLDMAPNEPNAVGNSVFWFVDTNGNGVWNEGEKIGHAAEVTKVDSDGNTLEVTSKAGQGGETSNHPAAPGYYDTEGYTRQYQRTLFGYSMWNPPPHPAGYRADTE